MNICTIPIQTMKIFYKSNYLVSFSSGRHWLWSEHLSSRFSTTTVGYARFQGLQNICVRNTQRNRIWAVKLPHSIQMPMSSVQALTSDFLTNHISNAFGGPRSLSRDVSWRLPKISCAQAQTRVISTTLAPKERIKQGFEKFKAETFNQQQELFSELANGQYPKFMVVACSDSRVCPTTILGFQPGEAFVVRNVANMVPPPEQAGFPGTSAALEYAVTALKVENILVIGHSKCGGIKALMTQKENAEKWSAHIEDWIKIGSGARSATLDAHSQHDLDKQCTECEKESVNNSLKNLLAFPFVKEAVTSGKLALHGGYYNFVDGSLEYWTFGADGKPSEASKF